MIQIITMAAAGGALVGTLLAGYFMAEYKDATWSAATNALKAEAAAVLAEGVQRVHAVEMEANSRARELEFNHAQTEKDLAVIQRRNRELATQLGGLRDPGRRASRTDALPTVTGGAQCPEESSTPRNLSAEASQLLLDAAAEADALAEYARTCHEWKETVETLFAHRAAIE